MLFDSFGELLSSMPAIRVESKQLHDPAFLVSFPRERQTQPLKDVQCREKDMNASFISLIPFLILLVSLTPFAI